MLQCPKLVVAQYSTPLSSELHRGSYWTSLASPTSGGEITVAALAIPVASLGQAMQSFNALNGLGATAGEELRYSAPPSAQLAMLEPSNSRQADLVGALASAVPLR